MAEYLYPTSAELTQIEQDLMPRLVADRPVFDFFPIRNADTPLVMWEQQDNYIGLQQARGLNGAPAKVQKVGVKRYQMPPGAYGEHISIDEVELTIRRQYGSFNTPIQIDDLVTDSQRQLLVRRLDRIESIVWTLLTTGTFAVAGPSGAIIHTDSYTTQSFTAAVPWSTAATSTPLADLRAVQLLSRGHSIRFDQSAKAYANRVTINRLLANTNAADVGGRRTMGLSTLNSLNQYNELFTMDGLPNLVPYDQGYLADITGTFTPFIPNGVVVVVGSRTDGGNIGSYLMTRNVQNPDLGPGAYTRVIDRGEQIIPRVVEVHDGHNGGPAIYFPSAIALMNV